MAASVNRGPLSISWSKPVMQKNNLQESASRIRPSAETQANLHITDPQCGKPTSTSCGSHVKQDLKTDADLMHPKK